MTAILDLAIEFVIRLLAAAISDGNRLVPDLCQEPAHQPGAVLRIATDGSDGTQVQFGTGNDQRESEGIIEVGADVGVDEHRNSLHFVGLKWPAIEQEKENQQD